jgi:hypothetical protein
MQASKEYVSKAIVSWQLYINSHADRKPKLDVHPRTRWDCQSKANRVKKHAVHPGVSSALLLHEHGTDTGSATRDTLHQHRESVAVQGYCPHNKYVPQRVGPTANPSEAGRIDGKHALREASGIKEKASDIRRERWKYRSFVGVKSIME